MPTPKAHKSTIQTPKAEKHHVKLPPPAPYPPPAADIPAYQYLEDDIETPREEPGWFSWGREESSNSAAEKWKRDREGCCNCCKDDMRTPEECAVQCIAPVFNAILAWGANPMTLQLIIYYGGGVVAFRYFENWAASDTIWFLTVTATTVGYGDFTPVTPLGRLFTAFFCLYGISVVLAALAPVIEILHGDWRSKMLESLGFKEKLTDEEVKKLTLDEMNRRINYKLRYALALISPAFVLLAGITFYYFMIRPEPDPEYVIDLMGLPGTQLDLMGLCDGFYYAVITMTTIGYGGTCVWWRCSTLTAARTHRSCTHYARTDTLSPHPLSPSLCQTLCPIHTSANGLAASTYH